MFNLFKSGKNKLAIGMLAVVMTLSLSVVAQGASTSTRVNFRVEPSMDSTIIKTLDPNVQVNILDINGDWIKAETDGVIGYINGEYVSVTESNATINGTSVRLRTTPAFDNNIAKNMLLNTGDRVLVCGQEVTDGNQFYSIFYKGKEYYVFNTLVDLDNGVEFAKAVNANEEKEEKLIDEIIKKVTSDITDESIAEAVIVEGDSLNATVNIQSGVLNIRKRPSVYSTKIASLNANARFNAVGQSPDGKWIAIVYNEIESWVSADYVKLDANVQLPVIEVAKLSVADELIEFAKSFDRNYRANDKWFDCSSYVKYVCANFGIKLSGGSNDIANSNAGVIITRAEAQPGDLVFIYNGAPIGHVGFYLGDGLMISNESSGIIRYDGSIGGGIKISSIDGPYWRNYAKSFMRLNNVQ